MMSGNYYNARYYYYRYYNAACELVGVCENNTNSRARVYTHFALNQTPDRVKINIRRSVQVGQGSTHNL